MGNPIPDSDRFTNAQVDKANSKTFKVGGVRDPSSDTAMFFNEDNALVQEHLKRSYRWI
jgi:hypothetical protein